MRAEPECISCMFTQLARICGHCDIDRSTQIELINKLAAKISNMDLELSPPELSSHVSKLLMGHLKIADPYEDVKRMENERAMAMLPESRRIMKNSADPLAMAIRLATASNVIDYGLPILIDLKDVLAGLAEREFGAFDIETIHARLKDAKNVLIVGDNTGEIAFDRLLLEELPKHAHYTYAVRSKPILNDSLKEDALFVGIDEYADIIESGSAIPGTVMESCSDEFKDNYAKADFIISKGQGNFETLVDENRPIVFLFAVKCSVIEEQLGLPKGTMMVMRSKTYNWS